MNSLLAKVKSFLGARKSPCDSAEHRALKQQIEELRKVTRGLEDTARARPAPVGSNGARRAAGGNGGIASAPAELLVLAAVALWR
jgi:hypothetical protein